MQQLIEAKKEGLTVGVETPKKRAPVIDLMQALQKSLGELPRKPAASAIKQESAKESNVTEIKKPNAGKRAPRTAHG
jgi:non-homologous end joining protein Ku